MNIAMAVYFVFMKNLREWWKCRNGAISSRALALSVYIHFNWNIFVKKLKQLFGGACVADNEPFLFSSFFPFDVIYFINLFEG